jgi:DNA repair exonuclease SbcCD ATPase subunit
VATARAAIAEMGSGPSADDARAALREHEAKITSARAAVDQLSGWPDALRRSDSAAEELPRLHSDIEAAELALARANDRVTEARAALAIADGTAISILAAAVAGHREELSRVRLDAANARADVTLAERALAQLPALEGAEAGARGKLEAKKGEARVFDVLAEVYGEIPAMIIESGSVAVQEIANQMLAEIGVPERIRIDTVGRNKTNDNVRDTFDIWVTDRNGFEEIIDCYSTGERFGIDIAFRRAVCAIQSARAQIDDPPPLMIDEGWGSLDAERRRAFPDVLRKVIESRMFSVVLTVSHVQEVIDAFQTKIVVNQAPDGSHVRIVRG